MILRRRFWLKKLLACGAVSAAGITLNGQDRFDPNLAGRNADLHLTKLEDQLKNGLRAVTPEQIEYLRTISRLVEQGTLPRAMVNLIFEWAIERNPRVPFPYFQFALRALAKRRGINVP